MADIDLVVFNDGDTYKKIREGINENFEKLKNISGQPGPEGPSGYSPSASVEQTDEGATITITDQSGTTTAKISNGKDGAPGQDGRDGAPGAPGAPGEIGPQGLPGKDGSSISDGTGAPSNDQGEDGDYYIDSSNGDFYHKENGTWSKFMTISGGGVTSSDVYMFDYKAGSEQYTDEEIHPLIGAITAGKVIIFKNNSLHSYQLPIAVNYDMMAPTILSFSIGTIDPDTYSTVYKFNLVKNETVWKQTVSASIILSRADIVDNLDGGSTTTVLSSKQGAKLKGLIDTINNTITTLQGRIDNIESGKITVTIVSQLPDTGDERTIYFVNKSGSLNDIYDEYMYIEGKWESIGSTAIDLSQYYDKAMIDGLLANKASVFKINSEEDLTTLSDAKPGDSAILNKVV